MPWQEMFPPGILFCSLLLYINFRQSLSESAADFVVDGPCGFCDVVSQDRVDAIGTHDDDLVADFYIRHVGNVDHALVHTDIAGNRAYHAVYDNLGLCGIWARIAVCIT